MPTLPPLQLASAAYTPGEGGAWSLQLAWNPTQPTGSTAYWVQMQLFDGADLATPVGNPVSTAAPNLPGGVWSPAAAGATLDPATVYWVSARATNAVTPTQQGPWASPLPVILGGPKLGGVHCDGSVMEVVWMPPAGPSLIGTYTAFVLDAAGSALAVLDAGGLGYPAADPPEGRHQRFDLTSASLRLAPAPLTVALAPTWRDSATGAVSYGPTDSAPLFTLPPVVASATHAGGTLGLEQSYSIAVVNRGLAGDTSPTFEVLVEADGVPVFQAPMPTTTPEGWTEPVGTITFPQFIPYFQHLTGTPAGMMLTVSLARLDGVSVGPFGPALPLPLDPPLVLAADCTPGPTGGVALELEYPPGAPLAGAARVQLWGAGGGLAVTGDFRGSRGFFGTGGIAAGEVVELTVSTLAGRSVGPPSPRIPLPTVAPTLTGASFDGRVARVSWQALDPAAVPGLSGYRVSLSSGGPAVAQVTVNDTAAALEVPAGGESLAVQVAAVAGVARGPWSAPIPLVGETAAALSATTDPVTGLTTLAWTAAEGASGYSLQFYLNDAASGAPVAVDEPTYLIPTPLSPNADQAVAGAVVTDTDGVPSTGPYSQPLPLPTAQPSGVTVDYDGATCSVAWQAAPGATGYRVSVLAGSAPAPFQQQDAGPGETGVSFALALADFAESYTVVVQARVEEGSGPPTPPVPLFAQGYVVSSAVSTDLPQPAVYPVSSLSGSAWDVVLFLPALGPAALQDLPFTQGAFALEASGRPEGDAYPLKLTLAAAGEAWNFAAAAPVRAQLRADYVAFLQGVETRGGAPWGVSLLQETISRAMPQTFQETLFYAYGLDAAGGTADLRPGMVLRVSLAGYETVPGQPSPTYLSGYAAQGVVDYEVGSYSAAAGWMVGMDAWIAQLVAGGALEVAAPLASVPEWQQAGVADAADLFYPAFVQPFYRLFVPSPLASPSELGSAYTPSNFVLAAAPSYTGLCNAVPNPGAGSAVAYFRGRAVVKACIRVWLNGMEVVVPIGTTVGNLLDRCAQRVPGGAALPGGLAMARPLGRAVLDPDRGWPAGRAFPVRLGGGTGSLPVYGPGVDALSLPLLHGDRLSLPL